MASESFARNFLLKLVVDKFGIHFSLDLWLVDEVTYNLFVGLDDWWMDRYDGWAADISDCCNLWVSAFAVPL